MALLLHSMLARLSGSSASETLMSDSIIQSPESLTISNATSVSPSISISTPMAHAYIASHRSSPEIHHLQRYLRSVLELPCFGYSSTFDEAEITEGRCRSLLPNLVLSNVNLDGVETWAEKNGNWESDHGADRSDAGWWSGLSDRLNFGVF